jgi:hypothetical protein
MNADGASEDQNEQELSGLPEGEEDEEEAGSELTSESGGPDDDAGPSQEAGGAAGDEESAPAEAGPSGAGAAALPKPGGGRFRPLAAHPLVAALAMQDGIDCKEDRQGYEAFVAQRAKKEQTLRTKSGQTPYSGEKRNKTQWDHLLEEMEWLAKDFTRCNGAACMGIAQHAWGCMHGTHARPASGPGIVLPTSPSSDVCVRSLQVEIWLHACGAGRPPPPAPALATPLHPCIHACTQGARLEVEAVQALCHLYQQVQPWHRGEGDQPREAGGRGHAQEGDVDGQAGL